MNSRNTLELVGILNDLSTLVVHGSNAMATVSAVLARAQTQARDVSASELEEARRAYTEILNVLKTG